MSTEPIVTVVTRHPDDADDIRTFGAASEVIYIDLGSSFDVTKLGIGDRTDEAILEWIEGHVDEARACANREAGQYAIETLIESVLDNMYVNIGHQEDCYTFEVIDRAWNSETHKHDLTVAERQTGFNGPEDAIDAFIAWARKVDA